MTTITHNLYALDEVKMAFLTALLKKEDLKECHYWLNEISLSLGAAELKRYLDQIYYDFYYATNSSYNTNSSSYADKLFHLNATPLVFLLKQMKQDKPKIIYINKKGSAVANWLAVIEDQRIHPFMRAVNKNNYNAISYYANNLLLQNGITGEVIVKALCSYYKAPFIAKEAGMSNDFQYVLAVYAKLYFLRRGYKTIERVGTVKKSVINYSIPLSIGAFKLTRWYNATNAETTTLGERLMNDPKLIAFGLSLRENISLTDTLFAAANYIKAQLNEDELENFIGAPEELLLDDCYSDILSEHKEKERIWLAKLGQDVRIKELMPMFADRWLSEVFPYIIINEKDMLYKMLELDY